MALAVGERVVLRRLNDADSAAFMAYRADPVVAEFQSWEPMSAERTAGFLAHCATVEPLLQPGLWTQIAIAETGNDALLGDVGLHLSENRQEIELGITLARAAQGRGLATEAVGLAVALVFETTQAHRIWGIADLRNTRSLRLLERAGFVPDHDETTDGITERFTYLDR